MSDLKQIGSYTIEKELGRGGMGVVYKAYDPQIARHVAIKTIHAPLLATPDGTTAIKRFLREARAASSTRHPNIIDTYLIDTQGQFPYIVMEFVEGSDLKSLMLDKEPLTIDEIVNIIDQVLQGLQSAHQAGIVHRDIKPANVLVTPSGQVKLTDFGIARMDDSNMTVLTMPGFQPGTPDYMSPEQCRGELVDARSDLFSTGTLLYEMLAREKPFKAEHPAGIMSNVLAIEPAPPSTLGRNIPAGFDSVLKKALAKNLSQRYQTADEFRQDLQKATWDGVAKTLGKYKIEGVLGNGAMGVVYKGYDSGLDRYVAIKTISKELLETNQAQHMLARFRNEAQLASRLTHPNIVGIYEFEHNHGSPYFAMEFIEGRDLESVLREQKLLPIHQVVHVVDCVLMALSHTHELGIVHRDIKPANVFINSRNVAKIADFGIARKNDSNMTQLGTIIGTPSYMSPEQCVGAEVDGRSDIFSVGVLLFEMLAGEKPFRGENLQNTMYNVVNTPHPPLAQFNKSVSKHWDAVLNKALSKKVEFRFQTAEEFRKAVHEAVRAPAILQWLLPSAAIAVMLVSSAAWIHYSTALYSDNPVGHVTVSTQAEQLAAKPVLKPLTQPTPSPVDKARSVDLETGKPGVAVVKKSSVTQPALQKNLEEQSLLLENAKIEEEMGRRSKAKALLKQGLETYKEDADFQQQIKQLLMSYYSADKREAVTKRSVDTLKRVIKNMQLLAPNAIEVASAKRDLQVLELKIDAEKKPAEFSTISVDTGTPKSVLNPIVTPSALTSNSVKNPPIDTRAEKLFNQFKLAFEAENLRQITAIANVLPENRELAQMIFTIYKNIRLDVNVSKIESLNQMRASFTVTSINNSLGQQVEAGERWKYFDVIARYDNNGSVKLFW